MTSLLPGTDLSTESQDGCLDNFVFNLILTFVPCLDPQIHETLCVTSTLITMLGKLFLCYRGEQMEPKTV